MVQIQNNCNTFYPLGRYEDAVEQLTEAIKLNPASALLYAKRATYVISFESILFFKENKFVLLLIFL